MDLRKLEIFTSVARTGSFSQAAGQLHMAQPAVSIAVRKLEDSLGLNLFDRSGRQVVLTPEGAQLLDRAEALLDQARELRQSAGELSGLLRGELSIACPSMLATYFLPDLLSDFLAEHAGLTASVIQAGTREVEAMLLQDKIELGITTTSGDHDLERLPIINEEMVVCVAPDHPWVGRSHIPVVDLESESMVVYESGYFIRAQLDELCRAAGIAPELRIQSNFLPLLLRMVKRGLGVTVGLRTMAQQEPDIHGIPLKPGVEVPMALAKRRGRTISRANQVFLDWAANRL